MRVEPLFDIEAHCWAVDYCGRVLESNSLRELQQRLPKAEIVGYHPNGYNVVRSPVLSSSNHWKPSYSYPRRQAKAAQAERARAAAPSQHELTMQRYNQQSQARAEAAKGVVIPPKRKLIDHDKLLELAAAGKNLLEIAIELDCAIDSAQHHVHQAKAAGDPRVANMVRRPSSTRTWSDEEDAVLRRLAADGFSSAQIGAQMHRSRNAVLGRCMRRGISLKGGDYAVAVHEWR